MCNSGNILIASADFDFVKRTLQLLYKQEYECEVVYEYKSALTKLSNNAYDLIITDFDLPGSKEYELAYQVRDNFDYLPIIAVTDSHKNSNTIEISELPIVAFITKVYIDDQLIRIIDHSMYFVKQQKIVKENIKNLHNWSDELERVLKFNCNKLNVSMTYKNYTAISMNNIIRCLNSIHKMMEISDSGNSQIQVCDMVDCPKLNALTQALLDAVNIIDKTRSSFKSKELASLKKRLLDILTEAIGREPVSPNKKRY